jgi:hypothetical protein
VTTVVALTTGLLLGACGADDGPTASQQVERRQQALAPRVVLYEVEGTAATVDIMFAGSTGLMNSQDNLAVPVVSEDGSPGIAVEMIAGQAATLTAQNRGRAGTVVCRITVDGDVLVEKSTTAPFGVTNCYGRIDSDLEPLQPA